MSGAESLNPFGGNEQNTHGVIAHQELHVCACGAQDVERSRANLIQNIEWLVCAKVRGLTFKKSSGRTYKPNIYPDDLRGRRQSVPNCLARRWCYFILRHHPRLGLSFPETGKRYKRDHTSVIHGYGRTLDDINAWRKTQHVELLEEICRTFGFEKLGVSLKQIAAERPAIKRVYKRKPKAETIDRAKMARNKAIIAAYDNGECMKRLAEQNRISKRRVQQILNKYGSGARSRSEAQKMAIKMGRKTPVTRDPAKLFQEIYPERNDRIVELSRAGVSHAEIARRLDVSSSAVSSVVYRRQARAQ